jgi:hypothetical protein
MSPRSSLPVRRSLTTLAVAGVVAIAVSACGAAATSPATGPAPTSAAATGMGGMSGMSGMATGNGLTGESSGFTFTPVTSALPATKAASFRFRIQAADGTPVTVFEPDQTKLMHFYLIRSDLTGFQHVHPTMAADGTWSAPLGAALSGSYRVYASFIVKDTTGTAMPLVLSRPLTVPGASTKPTPLPAPATGTQVDGYTLKLDTAQVMAGMDNPLTVTVSKNGTPVTDLQPYLDTYAHLTALHEGDLAFAHLHPQGAVNGDHGGPTLSFAADLPTAGNWRLFLQFQTGGVVHTAAVTLTAR